jgi:predicted DNA-binding transcriptional regulator YafY
MPIDEKIALIEQAIGSGGLLDIVYLKASDEKTRRLIKPRKVGPMEYQGKPFIGVDAYCMKRKDGRVFRVDRMLEIKPLNR